MKLQKLYYPTRYILLFSILLCIPVSSFIYAVDLPVSSDAIGFGIVQTNKSDPGMAWMLNQWLKSPKQNYLKSVTRKFTAEKSIAVVYEEPGSEDLGFGIITRPRKIWKLRLPNPAYPN